MIKQSVICTAMLLGAGEVINGLFMLIAPLTWYYTIPGVISTGAFNQHFLRDIGLIFLLLGAAVLVGVARRPYRVMLWALATIWLSGHALFHFWEVAVGICGPSALARDFLAVTLPALLGVALTLWASSDIHRVNSEYAYL